MVVTYVFFVAAAIAVLFSLVTITHRSPIVNVLSLVVVFFALASIFAILGMDFLAAVQVIVYSGAILVLFLFVIMLLNIRSAERMGRGRPIQVALGTVTAIGLGAAVVFALSSLAPERGAVLPGSDAGTVFPIGKALLGSHLFPFEFISLLLAAAIIGAVFLTRKETQ
jgi:NADH-quinone oxidoreductase subunit J